MKCVVCRNHDDGVVFNESLFCPICWDILEDLEKRPRKTKLLPGKWRGRLSGGVLEPEDFPKHDKAIIYQVRTFKITDPIDSSFGEACATESGDIVEIMQICNFVNTAPLNNYREIRIL